MQISDNNNSIVFSNDSFYFAAGKNGKALSLRINNGEELLADSNTSLFSLTQDRFFNNELKLMHTSREITVSCNGIRLENNCLFASFSPILPAF